jgi:hypothetical protein
VDLWHRRSPELLVERLSLIPRAPKQAELLAGFFAALLQPVRINFISQCSIGALGKADSLCKLGAQTG